MTDEKPRQFDIVKQGDWDEPWNVWGSLGTHLQVAWNMYFPFPKTNADIENLIEYADQLLTLGRETEVYDLVETARKYSWKAADGLTYGEFMRQTVKNTGKLPLIQPGAWYIDDKYVVRSKLCFYRDEQIVEEVIDNPGELLRELRPDMDRSIHGGFCADVPAVAVHGVLVNFDPPQYVTDKVHTYIELSSDIWLPFVSGLKEEHSGDLHWGWMYDNRELAERHTPRLNQFIEGAQDLTLRLGGQWELLNAAFRSYQPQITETGIDLDFDPVKWWEEHRDQLPRW